MSVEDEVRNDKKAPVIDTSEIVPPEGDTQSKEAVTSAFMRVVVVVLLLVILIGTMILITRYRPAVVGNALDKFPTFYLVWLAAVIGSAVNITTRDHRTAIPAGLLNRISYLAWKLLIAMTFATFLYVVFASELLRGDTFPRFQNVNLYLPHEFPGVV